MDVARFLKLTAFTSLFFLLDLNTDIGLAKQPNSTQGRKYFIDEAIFSSRKKLEINSVLIRDKKIGQSEPQEVTVNLSSTYDNPFDPEDINVTAEFISPLGEKIAIPGFFYQGYAREQVGSRTERLTLQGEPCWKVRFAARSIGEWKFYITAQDRSGEKKSGLYSFQVIESNNPGLIRRAKNSNNYLEFETGKPYFAIGESIAWANRNKQTYDYDYYFVKLYENKCNYSRVWIIPWHLALEWTNLGSPKGRFFGIGKYCLENAWRMDYILSLAEENGIYVMFTLGNYGDLMREKGLWNEQWWDSHPYNIANGGPCKTPWDFFTNNQAKDYYKNRLHYIIARWGYSPNILAFELFNEVDAPLEWVREMGGFIKENDPFGHLVTISLGYPDWSKKHPQEEQVWQLPEIDFTQLHIWGNGQPQDLVEELFNGIQGQILKYNKPCLVAEFGIDSLKDDTFYDKDGKGVNLHNGLWAATMSGSFAGAANWWWDSYVEPNGLYYHYKALVNFVEKVGWNKNWQSIKISQPQGLSDKVRILGLTATDEAIIWIQNKQSDWYGNFQKIEPQSLKGVSFGLLGIADGKYALQWWDTWNGEVIHETNSFAAGGKLLIEVPGFKRDIALKIRKNLF